MRAARAVRATVRDPGRAITPIGTCAAMPRQRSQRLNWTRLSDPMSQTKRTPGKRAFSAAMVSAVQRVPSRASIPVTTMRGSSAIRRAIAIRSARGAGPCGFSGLPGLTSHQTRSSRKRRSAISEMCRCPAWAGSNDPPSRPMRWPGKAIGFSSLSRSTVRESPASRARAEGRDCRRDRAFPCPRPHRLRPRFARGRRR